MSGTKRQRKQDRIEDARIFAHLKELAMKRLTRTAGSKELIPAHNPEQVIVTFQAWSEGHRSNSIYLN